MKVIIDESSCIKCGACASTCPKTFAFIDSEISINNSEVETITCEKEAAEGCPVQAIKLK